MYSSKQIGSKYTSSFKVYISENEKTISPFHDIPLRAGEYINCVNEIPRFEHAKFEISKEASFNPICQDIKKEKVRFVKNVFPSFGYPFNYGALPQTWEDPTVDDSECKAMGDNDPVDIIEIGSKVKKIGEVYQAKILGTLALLDDNEADWKVVVIDSKDEMASKLNDIDDIKKHMPGFLEFAYKWFRDYKVPDEKPKNKFAFDGKFLNAAFAKKVVEKAHESWKKLISNGHKGISIENVTQKESKGFLEKSIEVKGSSENDAPIPDELYKFFYVSD